MSTTRSSKVHILSQAAFISVLIIILQLLSSVLVKFGWFSISLVLVPVVLGGILMGPKYGAFFGGVFGAVVTLFCIIGFDPGGYVLFNASPLLCILTCMVKGIAAGFIPALVYQILYNSKHRPIFIIISAALAPILNTGIFIACMFLFFKPTLYEWAGETNVMTYVITALVGFNFIFEFILNVVLCPALFPALLKSRNVIKLTK